MTGADDPRGAPAGHARGAPAPDRYGVIGNPIGHSRSPAIHAQFAAQTGERVVYEPILAPLDGFAATVDAFRAAGGRGLNVTVPFKLEAFAYARAHTPRACAAGAVNTLRFDGDAVLGDNTDGIGLVNDVAGRLGCALAGARVLVLGAGGAVRGIVLPLLEAGVARLAIVNRTAARAHALADAFADARDPARLASAGYEAFERTTDVFDLIVNATSSGLADDAPPVPPAWFARARLAYDMVYGARPTRFMTQARAAGCPSVEDGLGMLVEQAAESFLLWRGVRPATGPVYDALRAALARDVR
jgi:shikimate dehydrogenase